MHGTPISGILQMVKRAALTPLPPMNQLPPIKPLPPTPQLPPVGSPPPMAPPKTNGLDWIANNGGNGQQYRQGMVNWNDEATRAVQPGMRLPTPQESAAGRMAPSPTFKISPVIQGQPAPSQVVSK